MSVFKRTLLVWAVLVSMFLVVVIGLSKFGGRIVDKVNTYSYYESATAHLAENEHDEAIEDFLKILEVRPKDAEVRSLLVESMIHLGTFREAQKQCDLLLEHSSEKELTLALRLQGQIQLAMGRWEEARVSLNAVVKADPQDAESHFNLAAIAESLESYPEMLASLKKLSSIADENPENEYVQRQSEELEALLGRVDTDPSIESYYYLGLVYRSLGRWDQTITAFEQCVRLPSPPADALYWLGVNAETHGDKEAAIGFYTRAIDTNSAHYRANTNLLRLLSE